MKLELRCRHNRDSDRRQQHSTGDYSERTSYTLSTFGGFDGATSSMATTIHHRSEALEKVGFVSSSSSKMDPRIDASPVLVQKAISHDESVNTHRLVAESKPSKMTCPATARIIDGEVSMYDWPLTSTERVMDKYGYKADLMQYTRRMDAALPMLASAKRESVLQGLKVINQVVADAWRSPKGGVELVPALCAHLQQKGDVDVLLKLYLTDEHDLRVEAGEVLECYLSNGSCEHLVQAGLMKDFIRGIIGNYSFPTATKPGVFTRQASDESVRLSVGLLEAVFRNGPETCQIAVDNGGLDYLIEICKCKVEIETLLHTAAAFSNLAIYGGPEMHKFMVTKHVPTWLFLLASHDDRRIKYYGCLAFCAIAATPEIDRSVKECDTIGLVRSFLKTYKPEDIAKLDVKYRSGRSMEYLMALGPMLNSPTPEGAGMAAFQLAMEAGLRKGSKQIDAVLQVFEKLGYLAKIKEIASQPFFELASRFAVHLLKSMGEAVPYKLSQNVPLWTPKDVQFWLHKVGYGEYTEMFSRHRVDGDLLLRTTDEHLREELGITSAYERLRFVRELNSLKRSADYGTVDRGRLDTFLIDLDQELSVYTYQMLQKGVDRSTLIHIDDQMLRDVCGIWNGVHRWKILRAVKDAKHEADLDLALLRKKVDIFISYRRANGSQLASLLKVHLQLSGYKVFIDVDRLAAGQFDKSILMNVRAAKHFILVLSPHALDQCIGDTECNDWVHLELKTAIEAGANIIPVQEKGFVWPVAESLPPDIRSVCGFNAVQWVHDYQQACVDKLHKYMNDPHSTPKSSSAKASSKRLTE